MPKEKIPIKHHISEKELNETIKDHEKTIKKQKLLIKTNKKRLELFYFLKYRYNKYSVEEAAKKVGKTKATGYNWQKIWNKEGKEGFEQITNRGPKPKLSEHDLKELINNFPEIEETSIKKLKNMIKEEYGHDFSIKHVRSIKRKIKEIKKYKGIYFNI